MNTQKICLKEKLSHWNEQEPVDKNIKDIIDMSALFCGIRDYSKIVYITRIDEQNREKLPCNYRDCERKPFFSIEELRKLGLTVIPFTQLSYDNKVLFHVWHIFTKGFPKEKIKRIIKSGFEEWYKNYFKIGITKKITQKDEMKWGRLLGYPECCIQHHIKRKGCHDGYKFPFTPHLACNHGCKKSKEINTKIRKFLLEHAPEDMIKYTEKKCKWENATVKDVQNRTHTAKYLKEKMPHPNPPKITKPPKIKMLVIGIGNTGSNMITGFYKTHNKATTITVDTDRNALNTTKADKKILIGKAIVAGLGTGGYPALGEQCAELNSDVLEKEVKDSDLVFILAGMGGGTGTGASPVIARIAKKNGAVVVGIVSTFSPEKHDKKEMVEKGVDELRKTADSVIMLDNAHWRLCYGNEGIEKKGGE